jgi:hypothetical protein
VQHRSAFPAGLRQHRVSAETVPRHQQGHPHHEQQVERRDQDEDAAEQPDRQKRQQHEGRVKNGGRIRRCKEIRTPPRRRDACLDALSRPGQHRLQRQAQEPGLGGGTGKRGQSGVLGGEIARAHQPQQGDTGHREGRPREDRPQRTGRPHPQHPVEDGHDEERHEQSHDMDEERERQPRPQALAQAAQKHVARDAVAVRLCRPVDKQHASGLAERPADIRSRSIRTGEDDLLTVDPGHGDRFLPRKRQDRSVAAILPRARRSAADLARQAEPGQKHRSVIERGQRMLRRQGAIEHDRRSLPSQAAQHLRQKMLERAATSTGTLRPRRLRWLGHPGIRCRATVGDIHAATCAGAPLSPPSVAERSRPSSTPSRVRTTTVVLAETFRRKARSRSTPSLSSA